jgi:hypothetical protein
MSGPYFLPDGLSRPALIAVFLILAACWCSGFFLERAGW